MKRKWFGEGERKEREREVWLCFGVVFFWFKKTRRRDDKKRRRDNYDRIACVFRNSNFVQGGKKAYLPT